LNAENRRFIEQHLAECSSCRQHQAALEKAISVLSIAAADMAVELRTPSLWPRLEERIQRHQEQSRSKWLWTLRESVQKESVLPRTVFSAAAAISAVICRSSLPGLETRLATFWPIELGPSFRAEDLALAEHSGL